jgi:hypothetical protein
MPKPKPDANRFTRQHRIALAILAGALLVRLWDLNARSLWLDEAMEYWVAVTPLARLAGAVRECIQDPPLYSFLLHGWMIPADNETWLRLLSVFFGVASVAGVMVIGYRLRGWTTAFVAGILMAIVPTAVRYSQEVGQYAPMQCFLVWSVVVLLGLVRNPTRGGFVRWGLLASAATYTYYGTVVTLLAPFACYLVEAAWRRDRRRLTGGLITLGAYGVSILPLIIYYLPHQLRRGPTADAFDPIRLGSPSVEVMRAWITLKETLAFQFTGWPCSNIPAWLPVILIVSLVVLVARSQRRLAVWFVAAWVAYAIMGRLRLFPFAFRYSIILAPLIVPLVACAIRGNTHWLRRLVTGLAFGILCAVCVVSLPNRSINDRIHGDSKCVWPETEDIGPVTRYWHQHRKPGQPTYVYYGAVPTFAYYADHLSGEKPDRPVGWYLDCWRNADTPWCRTGDIFYGRWLRALPPDQKMASIYETLSGMPDEFWMIIAHVQGAESVPIVQMLQRDYVLLDRVTASDALGILVRRRTP